MSPPGYSDRINHALAFAAKHHDRQVRGGTRLPYFTLPANVAIILTRYGQDETTVVAGILHEVVADSVRDGATRAFLDQRIGEKFGALTLDTSLAIVERRVDDEGVELSPSERREDLLRRLGAADTRGRWVLAAHALHTVASLVADLRRTVDTAAHWARYPGGRDGMVPWFRRLHDRLRVVGFDAPILGEFDEAIAELEARPT